MKRISWSLFLPGLCMMACGGAVDDELKDVEHSQEPVFNGSTTWDAEQERYTMQPTVRVLTPGGGICSGTALRNNVVLTARHCTTLLGNVDGTIASPTTMAVATSPNAPTAGCNSSTCRTVAAIETRATTLDVALLILSGNILVNGSPAGHSLRIDPFDPGLAEGRTLLVSGYGRNSALGGAGVLRTGQVRVIDASATWAPGRVNTGRAMTTQGVQPLSTGGQSMWSGDSGGPYWNQNDADPATTTVTQMPTLLAVHNHREGSGDSIVAYGTISIAFRNWVNTEIFERTGTLSMPLTSGSMSGLEVRTPVAGSSGPPTWTITSNGLTEPTNFNTPGPDVVGSMVLHTSVVYENFDMWVSVRGTDDDSVGLIFWYRDDRNYLRFSVNEQDGYARIIRMTPNGAVTVAENSNYTINFDTQKTLRVVTSGSFITAYVNGSQVLNTSDRDIMSGRVGLYENAMSNVTFKHWNVIPVAPMTTSVPF